MAFNQQNNNGTVNGANAYTNPATVRAYWANRGVNLSAKTNTKLKQAIVNATTYLNARYSWVGWQQRRLQGTQWPRGGVTSFLRGLPPALTVAVCMVANRALSGKPLMPNPTFNASGQKVTQVTKKVGPIKLSTTFAKSSGANLAAATPQFPKVTITLQQAGLVKSGNSGRLSRG